VDNPKHELRPGMFATLAFKTPMIEIEPFRSELAAERELSELASVTGAGSPERDAAIIERQKICPVTGLALGSMGKPLREMHAGRVVFLCCAGCPDKFRARSDYYVARLSKVTNQGVLAVPEQSVIDTGSQSVVYVEREPGIFEGIAVTLGPRAEGYYAVIDGLLAGDRVAAAGAFLVDAETRLNPSASATYFGASGSPDTKQAQ
jgi:Cu(I)/Ag(I) efflux system membrane fusion protein